MKIFVGLLTFAIVVLSSMPTLAAKPNDAAPKGGTFVLNLGGEPPTVHPIMSTDAYASDVQAYVMDSMVARDVETYEYQPRVAEKWEISKNNKVFTFYLRKGVKFHDGQEVTAEDVKFSFDAIFDPKYEAAHMIPYYEGIAKVEAVDKYTVRATAKDSYYKNFDVIAGLTIIPKHIYSDVEKSKKMTKELVGCGPYKLEKFERGQMIVLKRNANWYGYSTPQWKGAFNYDTINLRFYKEETVVLEHAKKGELDYIDLRAEAYMKKTDGKPWGETLFKKKVENSSPKSYGYIGWNMRNPLFQDREVRVALAHLMNRREMIKKFMFDMSEPANGPTYNRSLYASSAVKTIEFDPKLAGQMLAKAGWKDSDKDGVLDKVVGGKKTDFRFTLFFSNKDTEKYYTMYREDLKKAGIDMEIKYMEWNSFIKVLDDGNFDAVTLSWSGDIHWDPKQIWHSSGAVPGGSNFIAYKNPEVDKLIEQARIEPNEAKRIKMLKTVYEKIAYDAPYLFMFNAKYTLFAVSKKVQMPAETFKYDIGTNFWWMSPN